MPDLGSGYRARVAAPFEKWFDDHPEVTQKLERRLQKVWADAFIDGLRTYLEPTVV
jgi:hypothetical protein